MPATLAPKTQKFLGDLPPFYSDEPAAQTVLDVLGRELQRVENLANAIRFNAFPMNSDDTYGFLALQEVLLGLPRSPVGVTAPQRQAKVLAAIRKRDAGAATAWVDTLTQAFGTENWSHQEGPSAYSVTITMPFQSATYTSRQIEQLARQITPAHIQLGFVYGVGFIVGVSQIGLDNL